MFDCETNQDNKSTCPNISLMVNEKFKRQPRKTAERWAVRKNKNLNHQRQQEGVARQMRRSVANRSSSN